jgi:3-polyprenyl-4-hydroxybenzoate decarboxylase
VEAHITSEMASGSKLGIDATIPRCGMRGEGHKRGWPPLIKMDAVVQKMIDSLFGNAGDKI